MAASWLEELAEVLRVRPLERKVLLCGGYAEGHQVVERLARDAGPVLNLEVQTLREMVAEAAKPVLARRGVTALSANETYWIVYGLLRRLVREQTDFVKPEQLTPGLIRVFHRAVQDLREAGVRAEQLEEHAFENAAKGRFIRALLAGYERLLQERKGADYAAQAFLLPEAGGAGAGLMLARETVLGSRADREAFRRLSGGRGTVLRGGLPFTRGDSGFPAGSCRLFRANGVLAEVRECFRRLMEMGIAWDQAEILLSDYAGGVSAAEAVSRQLGVACAFAEGLPVGYSRVGRAALHLLDWIGSDFQADRLAAAFRDGSLRLREPEVPSSTAVAVLERSGIGWGRERYALLDRPEDWTAEERLVQAAAAVSGLVRAAFEGLEERGGSPEAVLGTVCRVLEAYGSGVSASPEEQAVFSQLEELHRSAGWWKEGGEEEREAFASPDGSVRLVRELVEGLRFRSAGMPMEGAVFVSSLQSGGLSGRPFTFLIGMSEPNWRQRPVQDPVLLDGERERVSPELVTGRQRAEDAYRERLLRLGLVRGSCTLSFSAYDLAERREQVPAYELLQVFRQQTGRWEADFEELQDALGPIVGYSPAYGRGALDEADTWMKPLVTDQGQIREGTEWVREAFGSLRDGAAALAARSGAGEPTAYDGLVDTAVHRLPFAADGSGKVFSASRLELYARCPMLFYFREVLGLRAKEGPVFDRTRWLDAMQRGSLLHAIFEHYYRPWVEEGRKGHDRGALAAITEAVLAQAGREIPAPSPHVREKECESIRRDADIFYRQESARTADPVYLELSLHTEEEPFRLELSEELSIPLRGFVDRVDRVGPHEYRIIDYKTGKPAKYREQEFFAGGTQLQHALYATAVEQWLVRSGRDLEARVVEAAYYFPTEKGLGEEMVRLQNRKEALEELLRSLLESMEGGVFPPTREPGNCRFCEYAVCCGPHAEWMKEKDGDRLKRLQEVYGHA